MRNAELAHIYTTQAKMFAISGAFRGGRSLEVALNAGGAEILTFARMS